MKKALASITAALLMCISCIPPVQQAGAEENAPVISCITDEGYNIDGHNYPTWASPLYSNLVPLEDGSWMRVQSFWYTFNQVNVEYYDSDFNLTKRICIPKRLQDFGGFYAASDGNYYLITGDGSNTQAGEYKKFDIAKYSKDWELLGHVDTVGSDVTAAFEAGTVRCADNGKQLVIHTSRKMASGHQSNYTIEVDMAEMKITYDSDKMGYVSHSFNQFVMFDGNDTVMLDHGDSYPRSVVLQRFSSSGGSAVLDLIEYGDTKDADISDMAILNFTGVAVGGFEQSSTHYIAAYNTINQDKWYDLAVGKHFLYSDSTRNVRIAAVPKDDLKTGSIKDIAVTNYPDGETRAGNPYLVPLSDDRFLLLWAHGDNIHYVFLDGTGSVDSEEYTMEGQLSGCAPVLSGNKVYWYTWKNSDIRFYSIDLNDPIQTAVIRRTAGHEFQTAEPDADGIVYDVCKKCGLHVQHDAQPSFIPVVYKLDCKSDRIERTYFNPDSDYLDDCDKFELYTDNITISEDTFLIDILEGNDYLLYDYITRTYLLTGFDEPSIPISIEIEPWSDHRKKQTVRMKAKHDYKFVQYTEPDSQQEGSITVQCSSCNHIVSFALDSLAGKGWNQVTAALNGGTVTIQLNDPETNTSQTLKEGKDFSVAYVTDPATNTAYTVIVAMKDSQLIYGSKVIAADSAQTVRIMGDVNADSALTIADAVLLSRWLLKEPETKLPDWNAGDMDQNGKLDAADLTLLKRALLNQKLGGKRDENTGYLFQC